MNPDQLARLRQQGMNVVPGTIQGLPVLLLALLHRAGAVAQSVAPAPAPAAPAQQPGRSMFCRRQVPPSRRQHTPHCPFRS